MTKYMEQNNFSNLGHLGPEQLQIMLVDETAKYEVLVEKSGVSLEQ